MPSEHNDHHEKERNHHNHHYHSTPVHFLKSGNHISSAAIIPTNQQYPPSSAPPRYGTVIPNRVFVGGIDFKTKEEDLHNYFCGFGVVKETKIIRDRAEVSKGYGFVTFDNPDDADKVREQDSFYLNGKKLNIGPAVRKQPPFYKDGAAPQAAPPAGSVPGNWVFHPTGGYASCTNQNGITYFSPVNPMLTAFPQHQPIIPHAPTAVMAAYNPPGNNNNNTAYSPVTAHSAPGGQYTTYCPPSNQVCGTVHVPINAPIAGACGQLLTPTGGHTNVDSVNVVQVPSQNMASHPGYIVPRSIHPNPQAVRVVLPATSTPPSTYSNSSPTGYYHHPTMMAPGSAMVAPGSAMVAPGSAMVAPAQYGIVTLQQDDISMMSSQTENDLNQAVADMSFSDH